MPDGVLYFPYMHVPADAWFTRVLLYWDRIGAIVPPARPGDQGAIGSYTAELIEQGLLTPLMPDEHYLPRLAAGFIQVLDADQDAGSRTGRSPDPDWTLIHVSKLGMELVRNLEQRRLARRGSGPSPDFWYEVESRTASLFMAYLAVVLGRAVGLSPITDDASAIAVLDGARSGLASDLERADRLQLGVIDAILPAPVRPIPVHELHRFKEEHRRQLTRLRSRVETAVLDAVNDDDNVRARRIELLRYDLQAELDELQEEMRRRRWPRIVLGGVCCLAAAAVSLGTVATGGLLGPTVLALPGFLTGVYTALGDLNVQPVAVRSPIAYAALAQAKFGT